MHGVAGSTSTETRSRLGDLHARSALALTALAAIVSALGWSPSPLFALFVAVVAVAIGMPHGALDVAIGPKLVHWAAFFPAYGAAAAITIAGWLVEPRAGLAVFLLLSWFHFGSGDVDGFGFDGPTKVARGIATGGLALGLPLVFHASIVAPIFDALMFGQHRFGAHEVRVWGAVILAAAVPTFIVAVVQHLLHLQWVGAAELASLALLGVTASPLIAFSVYFALWHSPRHLLRVKASAAAVVPTLAATALTIGGAFAAWMVLDPATTTAIRVVFVGLAALTGPHQFVTSGFRRSVARSGHPPVVHTI